MPATYNRLGVVSVNKKNSNTSGLIVDDNGGLELSLCTSVAESDDGFAIALRDYGSSQVISKTKSGMPNPGIIPVASSSNLGVIKVDGTTIVINDGVISSAARLTWS